MNRNQNHVDHGITEDQRYSLHQLEVALSCRSCNTRMISFALSPKNSDQNLDPSSYLSMVISTECGHFFCQLCWEKQLSKVSMRRPENHSKNCRKSEALSLGSPYLSRISDGIAQFKETQFESSRCPICQKIIHYPGTTVKSADTFFNLCSNDGMTQNGEKAKKSHFNCPRKVANLFQTISGGSVYNSTDMGNAWQQSKGGERPPIIPTQPPYILSQESLLSEHPPSYDYAAEMEQSHEDCLPDDCHLSDEEQSVTVLNNIIMSFPVPFPPFLQSQQSILSEHPPQSTSIWSSGPSEPLTEYYPSPDTYMSNSTMTDKQTDNIDPFQCSDKQSVEDISQRTTNALCERVPENCRSSPRGVQKSEVMGSLQGPINRCLSSGNQIASNPSGNFAAANSSDFDDKGLIKSYAISHVCAQHEASSDSVEEVCGTFANDIGNCTDEILPTETDIMALESGCVVEDTVASLEFEPGTQSSSNTPVESSLAGFTDSTETNVEVALPLPQVPITELSMTQCSPQNLPRKDGPDCRGSKSAAKNILAVPKIPVGFFPATKSSSTAVDSTSLDLTNFDDTAIEETLPPPRIPNTQLSMTQCLSPGLPLDCSPLHCPGSMNAASDKLEKTDDIFEAASTPVILVPATHSIATTVENNYLDLTTSDDNDTAIEATLPLPSIANTQLSMTQGCAPKLSKMDDGGDFRGSVKARSTVLSVTGTDHVFHQCRSDRNAAAVKCNSDLTIREAERNPQVDNEVNFVTREIDTIEKNSLDGKGHEGSAYIRSEKAEPKEVVQNGSRRGNCLESSSVRTSPKECDCFPSPKSIDSSTNCVERVAPSCRTWGGGTSAGLKSGHLSAAVRHVTPSNDDHVAKHKKMNSTENVRSLHSPILVVPDGLSLQQLERLRRLHANGSCFACKTVGWTERATFMFNAPILVTRSTKFYCPLKNGDFTVNVCNRSFEYLKALSLGLCIYDEAFLEMSESTGKWLTGDEFEIWGDYYLLAQMRACDEGNKRSHTWLAGIQVNRFGICRSARTFSRNVRSGRQLPRFWNYKFIVLNDFRSKVVPSKNISQRKNLDSWQMSEKTKGYLLAQQDALLWAGDQLAELSQLQVEQLIRILGGFIIPHIVVADLSPDYHYLVIVPDSVPAELLQYYLSASSELLSHFEFREMKYCKDMFPLSPNEVAAVRTSWIADGIGANMTPPINPYCCGILSPI